MSTNLDIGDELPVLRLTLSPEQIAAYALSANQGGPRFLSEEGAKNEGLPGQIAPGNMSLAIFSRVLAGSVPGARVCHVTGTFRSLVRPNVVLVASGVVTNREESDGGVTLHCDLLLESEEGDRLVTGTGVVVVSRARN